MLIIGIAGGTGSGKTTVVHQIMNELPQTEVGIISQDSYYRETASLSFDERALINFDHPRAIDFELLVGKQHPQLQLILRTRFLIFLFLFW